MFPGVSEEVKQLWKERVINQQKSGLSMAAWCRNNSVAVHSMCYWRAKFSQKILILTVLILVRSMKGSRLETLINQAFF